MSYVQKQKINTPPSKRHFHNQEGYLFLLPWLVGLVLFQFGPIVLNLAMSFTDYTMFNSASFLGLQNYKDMLSDPTFWKATKVTFSYVLISVPAKLIFALTVALVLNMKFKGISLLRTVYYIPSIFGSSIAVTILWKALFLKHGFVNILLKHIGIEGPAWLGNPKYVLFIIALLSVWQFGSSMVIFLAGLKQIPKALYESASVDGAGPINKFFYITIPGIMPMIIYNLLMQTINAFQMFAAPYIIFNGTGGPLNQALLYVIYLYQNAFKYFNIGYASALSWGLLIMIAVTTYTMNQLAKLVSDYE